jgi:hypothetical protein
VGSPGPEGPPGAGNVASFYDDTPGVVTLTKPPTPPTYTDIATVEITIPPSANHSVLLLATVTGHSEVAGSTSLGARIVVDGTSVIGPIYGKHECFAVDCDSGEVSLSRVVTLGPGTHTITLQGTIGVSDFYDVETFPLRIRALSAIDLGALPSP